MQELLEQLERASKKESPPKADLSNPLDQLKLRFIYQMKGEDQHFRSLLTHIKQVRHEVLQSAEELHFAELILNELDKMDE